MKKCTAVMVFNSAGEMALQKRAADDDRYPSRWDFAAGGHLDADESVEEGAKRELKEEIGIECPLEFVTLMHHPGGADVDDEPDELSIFKTTYDGPFAPDPKEVAEVRFFPIEKIKEMAAKEPQALHPELAFFLTRHSKRL
ncbi:NUDIX domain-containing protein [Candidatus Kaiserbacteria bacterium]|nr:NUDIX domain-containing protein [Candidatus Kaiserbacteria bacterium]